VLAATGAVAVLGAGAAWLVVAHRPPAGDQPGGGPALGFHGHAVQSQSTTTKEEEMRMKNESVRRAAVFFGVVLPSLAGASQAAQDGAVEDAAISACLEMHEKSYQCRDEFTEVMIDLHAASSGTPIPPEQRATMRAHLLRSLEETATGPIERRRARCRDMVEKMGERHLKVAASKGQPLKACYAESDCKARVACMRPILQELLGTELKAPPRKQ
jgi:hypothetical protein